jgi:AcrR family transcriptional regulator
LSSTLKTQEFVIGAQAPSLVRRLKGADRREEILNAAAALYVTYGPSKTTTRQIALAVGISQPSLYAHFPTKDALSYALAERSFEILESRMEKAEQVVDHPSALLATLISGYIHYALEEPSAYQIAFMLDLALEDEAQASLQVHVGLRAFGIFRDKVALLQQLNFLRAGRTDVIAQSIWAAMHGLCALLLARPLFPWADRDDLIGAHIELIVSGAQGSHI